MLEKNDKTIVEKIVEEGDKIIKVGEASESYRRVGGESFRYEGSNIQTYKI